MTDTERELVLELVSLLGIMANNLGFGDYCLEVNKLADMVRNEDELRKNNEDYIYSMEEGPNT